VRHNAMRRQPCNPQARKRGRRFTREISFWHDGTNSVQFRLFRGAKIGSLHAFEVS
jgi:hypothetical protein